MLVKKSLVRVLAITAESTKDGGTTPAAMVPLIHQMFGKQCDPLVANKLLNTLMHMGYVQVGTGTNIWTCSERGQREYEFIKSNRPNLLAPTNSPSLAMHA